MALPDAIPRLLRFGRHSVALQRRELLEDGVPVALGGRAYELLLALIDAKGKVISNEALMNRVWPGRVVEDNTLHAHLSALRKALGVDRSLIRTVSGRGYQFIADVEEDVGGRATPAPERQGTTNLPERVSALIGRESVVAEVAELVIAHRLVTLVGSGGIGKTRVGLEVARNLSQRYADGAWLAELGPLSDADLVPATVAAALGVLPVGGIVSGERVASAVKGRTILLVLDNCEHLVDAAARIAEDLLRANANVTILATSREPLLADAEYVYRVRPLEVPEEHATAGDDAMATGALSLFVARVQASDPAFRPDQRFTDMAATVCRCLDGIPLAIELAAVRCSALGIDELAARLDDRFRLLSGGRRTALPRHQTLLATFEWSFDLLEDAERLVFRRLAVFVGRFDLSAAIAVVPDDAVDAADVPHHVGQLVTKSLVIVDRSRGAVAYRLLETTRAYALEKLLDAQEFGRYAASHAAHYCRLLEGAQAEFASRSPAEWSTISGRDIDNVRAALAWARSLSGSADMAEALTLAAVPYWIHLSLIDECAVRVQQALNRDASAAARDPARDMRLLAALGSMLFYSDKGEEACAAWNRALSIARELGDEQCQLRALWGIWIDRLTRGGIRESLRVAETFLDVAPTDGERDELRLGHRLVGISLHFLGEHERAADHFRRMEEGYRASLTLSHITRFQLDPWVTARCFQARIRWLQGFPEQAMKIVATAIDEARSRGHAVSLATSLGLGACVVALLNGDLAVAESYAALLNEQSMRHGIVLWQAWGRCFSGALLVRRGDVERGLPLLEGELKAHPDIGLSSRYMMLLGELASALADRGEYRSARAVIDQALERAERDDELWYLPALMCIKGHVVLCESLPDAADVARSVFSQAIVKARKQRALSFELRATTALARLQAFSAAAPRARDELLGVFQRFTEGFETADLREARAVLEQLA